MDAQTAAARQQISSDQSTRVESQRIDRGVVRIGKPDPTIDLSEVIAADGGVSRTGRKIFNTVTSEGQVVRATQPIGSGISALDEISVSSDGLSNKIFTKEEEVLKKRKPVYSLFTNLFFLLEGSFGRDANALPPNPPNLPKPRHSGLFTRAKDLPPPSINVFPMASLNASIDFSPTPDQVLGTFTITLGCLSDWGIEFTISGTGIPNRSYDLILSENSVDVLTTRIRVDASDPPPNTPKATAKNFGNFFVETPAFNSSNSKTYVSASIGQQGGIKISVGTGFYIKDSSYNFVSPPTVFIPCAIVGDITLSYRFRFVQV